MASDRLLNIGSVVLAMGLGAGGFLAFSDKLSLAMLRGGPPPFVGQTLELNGMSYFPAPGATVQVGRLRLEGANLDGPQAAALFTGASGGDGGREAFAKMTAEKMVAPEIKIAFPGGSVLLRDVVLNHVGGGVATRIGFASGEAEAHVAQAGARFKLGPLTMRGADAGFLFATMRSGLVKGDYLRYAELKWDGLSGTSSLDDKADFGVTFDIGSLTAASAFEGDLPKTFAFDLPSLRVGPKSSMIAAVMSARAGMNEVDLGMRMKGSYDWAARRMIVDEMRVSLANLGALTVKGVFGNADRALLSSDQATRFAAVQSLTLENATIHFVNDGVVEKVLPLLPSKFKLPLGVSQGEAMASVDRLFAGLPADASAKQRTAALAAFALNPRSLTMMLKPRAGTAAMPLRSLTDAKDLSAFDTELRANE
jgi:hypothetical protein